MTERGKAIWFAVGGGATGGGVVVLVGGVGVAAGGTAFGATAALPFLGAVCGLAMYGWRVSGKLTAEGRRV